MNILVTALFSSIVSALTASIICLFLIVDFRAQPDATEQTKPTLEKSVCKPEDSHIFNECSFSLPTGESEKIIRVGYTLTIPNSFKIIKSEDPFMAKLYGLNKPVIAIGSTLSKVESYESVGQEIVLQQQKIKTELSLSEESVSGLYYTTQRDGMVWIGVLISVPDMTPSGFQELRTYLETRS